MSVTLLSVWTAIEIDEHGGVDHASGARSLRISTMRSLTEVRGASLCGRCLGSNGRGTTNSVPGGILLIVAHGSANVSH
jgi:hypothetical protein